jgi:hypothetical protein
VASVVGSGHKDVLLVYRHVPGKGDEDRFHQRGRRALAAPVRNEWTSAFEALAFSGIAFVVADAARRARSIE